MDDTNAASCGQIWQQFPSGMRLLLNFSREGHFQSLISEETVWLSWLEMICHDHNFSVKHSLQRCGGQGWYGLLVGFMSNSPNFHFRWVWMSECSNCADQNVDTNSTDSPRLQLLCRRSYVRVGQRPLFSMLATCRLQWKSRSSEYQLVLFHCFIVSPQFNVTMCALRLFASL